MSGDAHRWEPRFVGVVLLVGLVLPVPRAGRRAVGAAVAGAAQEVRRVERPGHGPVSTGGVPGSNALAAQGAGPARQLFPKKQYPQGHPALAQSLSNLGFLLQAQEKFTAAEPFLRGAGDVPALYPGRSSLRGILTWPAA